MNWPVLSLDEIQQNLSKSSAPSNYFASFNSWWGGYSLDPQSLLIPLDDHLVHRGDGVFEAIKATGNKIYLLDEHLSRMQVSAQALSLPLFHNLEEMKHIVQATWDLAVRQHNLKQGLLRLFLSRGGGAAH